MPDHDFKPTKTPGCGARGGRGEGQVTERSCLWCGHAPVSQKYCCDACRKAAWYKIHNPARPTTKSRKNAKRNVPCPLGHKVCCLCLRPWPATTEHFHSDRSKVDGLDDRCRACRNDRRRALSLGATPARPYGLRRQGWFARRMLRLEAAARKESSSCAT
jgi:hypothetical protein